MSLTSTGVFLSPKFMSHPYVLNHVIMSNSKCRLGLSDLNYLYVVGKFCSLDKATKRNHIAGS